MKKMISLCLCVFVREMVLLVLHTVVSRECRIQNGFDSEKNWKRYARGLSKVSELFENLEKHYAQWLSKVSEWKGNRTDRTDRTVTMFNDYLNSPECWKTISIVIQNGFVVVPSVPDGARNLSQSESATPMAFWTEMSKLSKMLFEN